MSKLIQSRELIEARTEIDPNSGCWLWNGSLNGQGYGLIVHKLAHRASYEEFVGEIPPGLVIDHLCRTPTCVNPRHLEPVTNSENIRRGRAREVFLAAKYMKGRNHRPASRKKMSATKRRLPERQITFRGRSMCLSDWAESIGITTRGLQNRLARKWPLERALTEASRGY